MGTWNALLDEFQGQASDAARIEWLNEQRRSALLAIGGLLDGSNVILYGSAFLQKPDAPPQLLSISHEDIDGLMAAVHGTDSSKGLVLVLHTPGGVTNAAETFVAYLRAKFDRIIAIVPTYAMSAGTMISLASEEIVMGRQSQLGPIDPQMNVGGRAISARAVVEQFERARYEIVGDPTTGAAGDLRLAHVWAPVLATIGPALLQEAQNALDYSEQMVASWLSSYMFNGSSRADQQGADVAAFFNDASRHKSHGRRIDRDEARSKGVQIKDLEDSQQLQEHVLTLYHLMTIVFQHSATTKLVESTAGGVWLKSWIEPHLGQGPGHGPTQPATRPQGPPVVPGSPQMNRQQRRQQDRRGR